MAGQKTNQATKGSHKHHLCRLTLTTAAWFGLVPLVPGVGWVVVVG